MVNEEQLRVLRRGAADWNAWRGRQVDEGKIDRFRPDLRGADLRGALLERAHLSWADLNGADLRGADLRGAMLIEADLRGANLIGADLLGATLVGANLDGAVLNTARLDEARLGEAILGEAELYGTYLLGADLRGADLHGAKLGGADIRGDLRRADLRGASLVEAKLIGADLREADLQGATLANTVLADVDLSTCKGLDSCIHRGPSMVDARTLQRSGPLPLAFLRGVGLPDRLIEYLPSLFGQPIQLYSCFISYSDKDRGFAERLHADLQAKGVRCWFAPEDLKIGDPIAEAIDAAIRHRDKLLLVLSEASVASAWVLKETRTALAEEKGRPGRPVLFPIRVDDAVMDTTEEWAHDIRRTRHIGDFSRWKDHDAYQRAFDRLLRDLRVEAA